MGCFSRMLIPNVYKSIIVMNSIDTRFSSNVFEAVQKTRSTCFIGKRDKKPQFVKRKQLFAFSRKCALLAYVSGPVCVCVCIIGNVCDFISDKLSLPFRRNTLF